MPLDPAAPRDLLFGLVALQNGLIDQDQLVAAFGAWARDKSRAIADRLIASGALDDDQRATIDRMVGHHVQKHGGDVEQSLAALGAGPSTRVKLATIADPDLDASLDLATRLPVADDPLATTATSGEFAGFAPTPTGPRFRVLREHARGGLGQVYIALDAELNREVALKEILDHRADDDASRARFLVEGEITGNLEHPGIVPVYGLGRHLDGRPYYAMRLIRGRTLHDAIADFHTDEALKADPGRRTIAFRELLARFIAVGNAIEYAHTRGVIHRDLKPGNVIVGDHGETLVVDWGLAKLVGRPDGSHAEATIAPSASGSAGATAAGQAVGTPAYMPPEQAEGNPDAHDRRSDVYALGATLYAILTGQPPFAGSTAEILANVARGQFPPPRSVDPTIDPALEAIARKAMALRSTDRYESATALVTDLARWLADEPVTAHRESFARRARRWAKHHRTGVTAAAASLLVAVIGSAVVLFVQSRANADLKASNEQLTQANARVLKANNDLNRATDRVQARFDLAHEAIKTFQATIIDDQILKNEQHRDLWTSLLRTAAEFHNKLAAVLEGDHSEHSEAALSRTFFSLANLNIEIGDQKLAITLFRKALAISEKLAADHPDRAEYRNDVARCQNNIGLLLSRTGDIEGATRALHQALAIAKELTVEQPGSTKYQNDLAKCQSSIGRLNLATGDVAGALQAFRQALVIRERLAAGQSDLAAPQINLADSYHDIGTTLGDTANAADALQALRRALAIRERLAADQPTISRYQNDLADTHFQIGLQLRVIGNVAGGLQAHLQALAIRERLAAENPAVTNYRSKLSLSHQNIGVSLATTGDVAGALQSYRRALSIREQLATAQPNVTSFQSDLADSLHNIGLELKDAAGALQALRRALAIRERLATENPTIAEFQNRLAVSHHVIGNSLEATGDITGALQAYRRALAIRERLAAENPTIAEFQNRLAASHLELGNLSRNTSDPVGALQAYQRALAIRERLAADHPDVPDYQLGLADNYNNIGVQLATAGDAAGALQSHHQALAIYKKLRSDRPEITRYRNGLATSYYNLACWHSLMAGHSTPRDGTLAESFPSRHGDQAMSALRCALADGFDQLDLIKQDHDLDPLRNRPDFQLLMMDLAMPTSPFAP